MGPVVVVPLVERVERRPSSSRAAPSCGTRGTACPRGGTDRSSRGSGERCSSSGRASGSTQIHTKPHRRSQRSSPRRRRGVSSVVRPNSSGSSTNEHEPSRSQRQPWNGQVICTVGESHRSRAPAACPGGDTSCSTPGSSSSARTHDQDRLVRDLVLDEGTRRRELLLATRDLPGARPQALGLDLGERAARVALLRDEGRSEVPGVVPGAGVGRGTGRFEVQHHADQTTRGRRGKAGLSPPGSTIARSPPHRRPATRPGPRGTP